MKMTWIGRIVSVAVCLPFVMSASMKLTSNPQVLEGMVHFGIPETLILPLGIIEALCVVIYLVPLTSVLGAILLTGYLGGAIVTHLRMGDPVYIQVALGIVIWLGLFLQDARIRQILPIKKR